MAFQTTSKWRKFFLPSLNPQTYTPGIGSSWSGASQSRANTYCCCRVPMAVDIPVSRSGKPLHGILVKHWGQRSWWPLHWPALTLTFWGHEDPSSLKIAARDRFMTVITSLSLSSAHTLFHQACSRIQFLDVWNGSGIHMLRQTWMGWFRDWKKHAETEHGSGESVGKP